MPVSADQVRNLQTRPVGLPDLITGHRAGNQQVDEHISFVNLGMSAVT
jgi:hypothetical protein